MSDRPILVAEKRNFGKEVKDTVTKSDDLSSVKYLKKKYTRMNFNSYLLALLFSFISVVTIFITGNIGFVFFIVLFTLSALLLLHDIKKQKVWDELDIIVKAVK